jgi:nicotinamide riboside transporter PnuC
VTVVGVAAAVLFVLAFLFAWPLWVAQNIGHALAFAAAGLLCALLAGLGPTVVSVVRRPPPSA